MDPLLVLCEHVGYFTRDEARSAGYDDRAVARAMAGGVWHRIRRGYYTFPHLWDAMGPVERHLVLARSIQHHIGPVVAFSHVTGSLIHGLATWGVPLDRVHVTRLDGGAGRIEGDVVHHEGFVPDTDVVEVDGLLVMVADRCAVETGIQGSAESALVSFDSFLHLAKGTHADLRHRFETMAHWPGAQHLHVPIRMADGGAESVGETRGRWLFRLAHLPAPETQFQVCDADGVVRGTTDWGWRRHRLLGEFDGRVKYGRLLVPGQEPGDAVFAEKRREDLLRELSGFSMFRLVWADYDRPRVTARRVGDLLRRSA